MYIRFGPKDRALVGQAMSAISNRLKSSYDEIMISKMIQLRTGNNTLGCI